MKKLLITIFILSLCGTLFATTPYSMKKVDNSGKNATLVVTYPVFQGKSELIKVANKSIYDTIKYQIDRNKTFIEEYGDGEGYINTSYAIIARADNKIISVLWVGDWNAGGVHNDIIYTATFGVINGKAKRLKINDIYSPEKAAEDIINAFKTNKGVSSIPQQYQDGELTVDAILNEENQELLNSFIISDKYITFYRKEYEFGYGYEGASFIKLPFKI